MTGKGIRYEWRFKRKLEARRGIVFVLRTAASHGPFDLISLHNANGASWVGFWQLKSSKMGCVAATNLITQLWLKHGMPHDCVYNVVPRTKDREFCEHCPMPTWRRRPREGGSGVVRRPDAARSRPDTFRKGR